MFSSLSVLWDQKLWDRVMILDLLLYNTKRHNRLSGTVLRPIAVMVRFGVGEKFYWSLKISDRWNFEME